MAERKSFFPQKLDTKMFLNWHFLVPTYQNIECPLLTPVAETHHLRSLEFYPLMEKRRKYQRG